MHVIDVTGVSERGRGGVRSEGAQYSACVQSGLTCFFLWKQIDFTIVVLNHWGRDWTAVGMCVQS